VPGSGITGQPGHDRHGLVRQLLRHVHPHLHPVGRDLDAWDRVVALVQGLDVHLLVDVEAAGVDGDVGAVAVCTDAIRELAPRTTTVRGSTCGGPSTMPSGGVPASTVTGNERDTT
jgi:hypothetical protein